MGNIKLNKDQKSGMLCIFIIVFAYAAERMIELFLPSSKTLGIILAMVYTLLLAFVVFTLSKCEDVKTGLLATLLGYKMMPVSVSFLNEYSAEAYLLYCYVKFAAIVMFIYLMYKFYMKQQPPREIKAPVVLAIVFAVPFFNQISSTTQTYLLSKTGSMLLPYFADCAGYAAATLVIIGIAYASSLESLKFAVTFEAIAITINALKVCARIGYRIINSWHISGSYYLWLVVYVLLIVVCVTALKFKAIKDANKS